MDNENIKHSSKNEEKFYQKIGFWIFVGILGWVLSFVIFFAWNLQISAPEFLKIFEKIEAKDIGDSFNILNSLVGIFTIILVYFTYKTQKEELQETKAVFEEQKKIMDEERFYNQYNFLLEQKDKIVNSLNGRIMMTKGNKVFVGYDIFKYFFDTDSDDSIFFLRLEIKKIENYYTSDDGRIEIDDDSHHQYMEVLRNELWRKEFSFTDFYNNNTGELSRYIRLVKILKSKVDFFYDCNFNFFIFKNKEEELFFEELSKRYSKI